uniref:Uncharacterized protein n=1 Tax=Rhodnius prolixus TaxID=13249 RepID=T1I8V4_RHOPR
MDSSDACLENTPPSIKETAENVISNVNTIRRKIEAVWRITYALKWMKSRKQIDDRTQSMPIQSVVDVEAISSSTCIISTAPAADVLDTVVDPLGRIHSFTFPAQLDSVIWMKQCVFIIDDRTQSMPIQSVVDVEAISLSTCIISTAPAADVLTPSLIRPAQLDSVIWCFIITIQMFLRSPFQPYRISVFGFGFSKRIGRHYIFLIIFFYSNTLLYSLSLFYTNVLYTIDRLWRQLTIKT